MKTRVSRLSAQSFYRHESVALDQGGWPAQFLQRSVIEDPGSLNVNIALFGVSAGEIAAVVRVSHGRTNDLKVQETRSIRRREMASLRKEKSIVSMIFDVSVVLLPWLVAVVGNGRRGLGVVVDRLDRWIRGLSYSSRQTPNALDVWFSVAMSIKQSCSFQPFELFISNAGESKQREVLISFRNASDLF